ncbi:P-loop containing nucleoside triphosphate hydrolase protein [Aspergillus ellipticus CBS 707.79]|uniref:P-loop containing nucleoside triphosphate hydrolase protein n=1 Tax=Aspergillus ellipticus CBS 707.79 TaxID=1448320 RepID=A0A319CVF0_9EURO|nr:P-loop containing nucleoside triphosphate hydrolase protein [Aspergillus ellipticus CBS 707.79]
METRISTMQGVTCTSTDSPDGQTFASSDLGSPLNPSGKRFNARTWAQSIPNGAAERGQEFRRVGLCFQELSVFGYSTATDFQKTVANIWLALPGMLARRLWPRASASKQNRVDIPRQFDGIIHAGDMCVVLGPPGSGCSTFLRAISGDRNGICINQDSYFSYQGISDKEMHTANRGDVIYTAEVDVYFPMLTVGETLTFAASARCPRELPKGISHQQYCEHLRDVTMAMYGISHTIHTKVGDEFVREVSGGERKRVTIAEATLSNAPFQCWDNSTRGLDAANAVEFCKTLRLQSEALILYEGRQIYFGPASRAKAYFVDLGFECPDRQTTPDFLKSMAFPAQRVPRQGCNTPRTADDFAAAWKQSAEYEALQREIEAYKAQHPIGGADAVKYRLLKQTYQAKGQRPSSPYMLSYSQQVMLCMWRGWRRFWADPGPAIWNPSTDGPLFSSWLFWYTLASLPTFALFHFPVGLAHDASSAAGDQATSRGFLMYLLFLTFLLWVSTFVHLCIAIAPSADSAGNIANFLFVRAFFFCGVVASPDKMPRFWIFLYRASPLSYYVSAVLSTGLANEVMVLDPAMAGQTCGDYLGAYIEQVGGYLADADAVTSCRDCRAKETNVILRTVGVEHGSRWRDLGILWVYVLFNVVGALAGYWLARVPRGRK